MITNFISFEISLVEIGNPAKLQRHIHQQLCEQGQPLRWAITAIDPILHSATIEAVVTIS
jgi:hypothetical protein